MKITSSDELDCETVSRKTSWKRGRSEDDSNLWGVYGSFRLKWAAFLIFERPPITVSWVTTRVSRWLIPFAQWHPNQGLRKMRHPRRNWSSSWMRIWEDFWAFTHDRYDEYPCRTTKYRRVTAGTAVKNRFWRQLCHGVPQSWMPETKVIPSWTSWTRNWLKNESVTQIRMIKWSKNPQFWGDCFKTIPHLIFNKHKHFEW
jgi:hypothetical protein